MKDQNLVISTRGITKRFSKRIVLERLDFELPQGQIYGLSGPNGSGKSVFLRILTGLIYPNTGSVEIFGQQVGAEVEFPRSTGALIDRPGFLSASSGYRNLELLASIRGVTSPAKIIETMYFIGLDPHDKKPVGAYSTGMFGLLGPNGAGKTTLMRILAGIASPSSGSAVVDGHDLSTESGKRAVKSTLGYLPQELGMYNELSAYQFVDYMAILKGLDDPPERRRQVENALGEVGLSREAGRKIKGYSGGMKRRVGIAQALVNDPRLLIVDEPTSGLDPEERIRFRNLLVNLSSDRTVILSTHIVEDIGQTCQDLAVLVHGRVIFRGSPVTLTRAASGHVWTLTCPGMEKPNHDLTVLSMLHLAEGTQYRLVGPSAADYPTAQEVEPGLEDGYVWLMKSAGQPVEALS